MGGETTGQRAAIIYTLAECARRYGQLHPSIALSHAADRIAEERLDQLTKSHSFAVLLHASHRLPPDKLRELSEVHPGECIVILEKYPESGLRKSFRSINCLKPRVLGVLDTVTKSAG